MTRDQFDALVTRLERKAAAAPGPFVLRVVGLALGGYAVLLCTLGLTVALTVGVCFVMIAAPRAGVIKLGLAALVLLGGFGLSVVRALWIRAESPTGLRLCAARTPELFAMIERLRARLRCAPFDDVLITGEFNAGISQVPRLGVFGWQRNVLVLGLPLMQALSARQFEAVLAHEFAHLSGNHGRLSTWLYRLRRSWEVVFRDQSSRGSGGWLVGGFVSWFWPRFNAHAFVLSRAQEYEADAMAADHAGARAMASALLRTAVHHRHLDETLWAAVGREAASSPEPPGDVFARTGALLHAGPPTDSLAGWLRQSLLMDTTTLDTHPCLRDRLEALGQLPTGVGLGHFPDAVPPIDGPTAAQAFLGAGEASLTVALSKQWRASVREAWRIQFEEAQQARESLPTLTARAAETESDDERVDRLWKQAAAARAAGGVDTALPVVREILTIRPDFPIANYALGAHLLQRDDPSGIEYMHRAVDGDPYLAEAGLGEIASFYHRNGMRAKRRQTEARLDELQHAFAEFRAERSSATARDHFLPHALDADTLARVSGLLAREPFIRDVVVARKQVQHFPDRPMYVVGVSIEVPFWQFRSAKADRDLVERLVEAIALDGPTYVFVRRGDLASLGRKVAAVDAALVYSRAA